MFLETKTDTIRETLINGGLQVRRDHFRAGDIIEVTAAESVQLLNDGEAVATALTTASLPFKSETQRNPAFSDGVGGKLPADAPGALMNDGNGILYWGIAGSGSGNTSSLTDNGDGTFTHNDGTGMVTTFQGGPEVVTSLAYSVVTKVLTYTKEDGSTDIVNLSALDDDIYVTGGSFDPATGVLTLTDNNGGTPDISVDLSSLTVTLADATTAADDATGDGGTSADAARADHKHAAQAVSADAGNVLKAGADGLHLLDPADLVQPADAVSPAADDAAGAVGTATEYAREDHKHAAQGVSADAGNDLTVGSDGLHFIKETETALVISATRELEYTDETGTATALDLSMTGADGTNPGVEGFAPQPGATDDGKFLRGDGTWSDVPAAVSPADAVSPAADNAAGVVGVGLEYAREDHKHPAQGVSADPGNLLTIGSDGLHHFAEIDEVVESTGALAGAAPVGAQWGIDTTTGQAYYVSGGVWTAFPVSTVDLNLTVSDQNGNSAGAAPISPPVGPDTGDVHLEVYDDSAVWFSWGGAAWAVSASAPLGVTMVGATASVDGVAGLVPTPSAGDHIKVLYGDGTWQDDKVERTFERVNQVGHGFALLQPLTHDGANWTAAQANSESTVAEGVVTNIVDANNFEVTTHGLATVSAHGLTSGEWYWLGQTASTVTATQPTSGIAQSLLKAIGTDAIRVDCGQAQQLSVDVGGVNVAPETNWSEGDFAIWNDTLNQFEPISPEFVTGTTAAATLTQVNSSTAYPSLFFDTDAWVVNLGATDPASGFCVISQCRYIQFGKVRHYSVDVYLDTDISIGISVTGAIGIAAVSSIGLTTVDGAATPIEVVAVQLEDNLVHVNRVDSENDDTRCNIAFTALMP